MAGFQGADTDQLRDHGTSCRTGASRISEVLDRAGAAIDGVEWVGPDADAFREEWYGTIRPGAQDSLERLRTLSDALAKQADDQDDTSLTDGGSWIGDLIDRFTRGDGGIGGPLLPLPLPLPGLPLDPSILGGLQDALENWQSGNGATGPQLFYGDGGNGGTGNIFGEGRPIGTQFDENGTLWDGREIENEHGYLDAYGGLSANAGTNVTTDPYGNTTATAGARVSGEIGVNEHLNLPGGTSLDASARAGFEAYGEAGTTFGPDGFSAAARAGSGVYAHADATYNGPGGSEAGLAVDGFLGARANAYTYNHVTRNEDGDVNGVSFGGGADAFVGGELSTTFSGTSPGGWFSGSTSVGVQGGAGAGASGGGVISTDEIGFSLGGELAVELGLSGDTSFSVHPNAIVNTFTPGDYDIDDAVGDARGAFDGATNAIGDAASAINPFD